ncbi:MAG: HD domain-containing protein [Lentisphaeria bacterium]|nr:HD domain-containing protein [Lentisphaeria bacterium]
MSVETNHDIPDSVSLFDGVAQAAKTILEASPACHDWDHTLRVLGNARRICETEEADLVVVECAAVLHDIGRPEELANQGKTCHAKRGGELTMGILEELGVTDHSFMQHVADCVRTHRFRNRGDGAPTTVEARIIFDADKLDSIGAIGIARSFHFAGRIGARVHNREDEALGSDSYSTEDSAYREYLVKLRHVRGRMLTETGRRLALARHTFMESFFTQINREAGGQDLLDPC